jgi:hypothetical protein
MNYLIGVVFCVALAVGAVQAWYFFSHCWSTPVLQMSSGCALILYNSR